VCGMLSITRRVEIEWGHCDPAGIIYYPQFLAMFDWSAAKLLQKALGMTKREMLSTFDCGGIPVVKTDATFRVPCSFGEVVDITSTLLELGRSSFHIRHVLTKDDTLCVESTQIRVWVGRAQSDPSKIRSVPIPADVARRLTQAN
jgi:4-hydroxybenzoyl-CoA thioesterase